MVEQMIALQSSINRLEDLRDRDSFPAHLLSAVDDAIEAVEAARAAHSVIAGKVAELERLLRQARHHVMFVADVDPNASDLANAIDGALAPYPERR